MLHDPKGKPWIHQSPGTRALPLTVSSFGRPQFWNVKLLSRFAASANGSPSPSINGHALQDEEEHETADSLKAKQQEMEQQVYQVWTVLSAFEESSAACISEMLAHVSNSLYMEAVNMAERFIFHVEVLFATIDELETHFIAVNAKGASLLLPPPVDLHA